MAEHNEIGKKGEEIAREYLIKQGYKIKYANWRKYKYEIDLIATHQGFLVVIEVKSRTGDEHGDPRDAITSKKRKDLIEATNLFIEDYKQDVEVRFDVVEVVFSTDNSHKINLISDAFNAIG
ncbi:MAG: putative endonuclease [Flavobacteriales bacterium]